MATEDGLEQEIAEVTEIKAFSLGLSSVLSVTSCWKFQVRAINVRPLAFLGITARLPPGSSQVSVSLVGIG